MPYIRFGLGCCLDVNSNGICDADEQTTTTTTLRDWVICSKDADCGATRVEYICRENDVFKLTISFFCRSAGLRSSNCDMDVVDDLVDRCGAGEQCVKGRGTCQRNWAPNNLAR